MKKLILFVIMVIVLVSVAVFLFSGGIKESLESTSPSSDDSGSPALSPLTTPISTTEAPSPTPPLSPGVSPAPSPSVTPIVVSQKVTVTYSGSGYSPSTITIKKGDFVVFENNGSRTMWIASAVHPTHRAYPDSGIHLCGIQTLVTNFDACRGYASGESWEFKFDSKGTWKYHNHLQPNHSGTIIVE